jgi:hypothetical protein
MKNPLSLVNQYDKWARNYEEDVLLSVRYAYRMIIETKKGREDWLDHISASSSTTDEMNNWCSLWKIKIPSKVCVFAWMLVHHNLPSADGLHRRSMAKQAGCSICNAMAESWCRSLLDCSMSRCIWALVDEDKTEHGSSSY